jgi:hypothetical protein
MRIGALAIGNSGFFLREGLKLRASELEKLKDALPEARKARELLHKKASEIFGRKTEPE